MNKFQLISAGQKLTKCSDDLCDVMSKISRASKEGEIAHERLLGANAEIERVIEYISSEFMEVM